MNKKVCFFLRDTFRGKSGRMFQAAFSRGIFLRPPQIRRIYVQSFNRVQKMREGPMQYIANIGHAPRERKEATNKLQCTITLFRTQKICMS